MFPHPYLTANESFSVNLTSFSCSFHSVDATDEIIGKTVANSSVSSMKKSSGVYAGNVRQGGIGNWRKMFTVQDSNDFGEFSAGGAAYNTTRVQPDHHPLVDVEYLKQMEGTGLKYDFGDGLVM